MSNQLGFTFYPKDWWTSDSFFLLQPFERYIYLECLFMMYANDGWISSNKLIVERRLNTTIKDEVWSKITDLMVEDGGQITHVSVNKRLRKTLANRENGLKGGRPKKEANSEEISAPEKPKKPKKETQKNPPLEREDEREIEIKENRTEVENKTGSFSSSSTQQILISKQISVDQWAIMFKVPKERIHECIKEFSEFKFRHNENTWRNETDLTKNFEFWLRSNAVPKTVKSQPQNLNHGSFQKAKRR